MTEWTHHWLKADGRRVKVIIVGYQPKSRAVKVLTTRHTICWVPRKRLRPIKESS